MKKLTIISLITTLILSLFFNPGKCSAQSQELQQLLLDIEKLTQMKSILADMKTGYQIYQQGYGAISGLSKGNFDLHSTYLNGLLTVNPAVRNYGRIADIILIQSSLMREYRQAVGRYKRSGSFSTGELTYFGEVYSKLVTASLEGLGELANVLTAGKLRMSDAERISAIDRVYEGIEDKLQFLRSFNRQNNLILLQRNREQNDARTVRGLYNINP